MKIFYNMAQLKLTEMQIKFKSNKNNKLILLNFKEIIIKTIKGIKMTKLVIVESLRLKWYHLTQMTGKRTRTELSVIAINLMTIKKLFNKNLMMALQHLLWVGFYQEVRSVEPSYCHHPVTFKDLKLYLHRKNLHLIKMVDMLSLFQN